MVKGGGKVVGFEEKQVQARKWIGTNSLLLMKTPLSQYYFSYDETI